MTHSGDPERLPVNILLLKWQEMEGYPRAVLNVGTKGFHVDLTDVKHISTVSDKSFHPFLNF